MNKGQVDVYCLAHGNPERTERCLRAMNNSTYANVILHLIDNGSNPRMPKKLRDLADVTHRSDKNAPFCLAMNRWVVVGKGEYILELNNDCYVMPDCLERLVGVMEEHSEVGMVGPKLIYPNGLIQSAGVVMNKYFLTEPYKRGTRHDPRVNMHGPIESVTGACVLIRRSIWNTLGGLNTDYVPGAHEDIDMCYRVRELGFAVWYESKAEAYHEESVTFKAVDWDTYSKNSHRTNKLLVDTWYKKLRILPHQPNQQKYT